tara:strand:+ start:203805 stop:204986 length:1182 start_codon:yes stop_codon:yes gene_type:complete
LILLTEHYRWAKKAGAIVLCYACGLLWGNADFLKSEIESSDLAQIQSQFADIAIAMALPMLLMTLDVKRWRRHANRAILSMLFATTAVVTISSALFFLLPTEGDNTIDASHLAGMAVGVYTGGTPNLAAIKAGLDIPNAHYLIFHSLDTLVGAFYLMFMLSVAIPLIRRWLPYSASNAQNNNSSLSSQDNVDRSDTSARALDVYGEDYKPLLQPRYWIQLGYITLLSLLCVGLAVAITDWAVTHLDWQSPTALTIVLLTLSGIALSFIPAIQRQRLAYRYGMYWIYMFCFAVASMANVDSLTQVNPIIILFIIGVVVGSLLLHATLCKLFRVDADTFMVTSVAAICSPPFVPLMARALNNSSLILSGMTTGIIGYALGNVLGISLALALSSIP